MSDPSFKECRKRKTQDTTTTDSIETSADGEEIFTLRRYGKWTDEEECFAVELIKNFKIGKLQDCEIGCMLRSYLARKLLCSPMRISKKFCGSNQLGKQVYRGSRLNANTTTDVADDAVDPQQNLLELERLFLETLDDETPVKPVRKPKPSPKNISLTTRDSISDFKTCLLSEPSSNGSVENYNFDDESQELSSLDILDIEDIDEFINKEYHFEFLPFTFLSN